MPLYVSINQNVSQNLTPTQLVQLFYVTGLPPFTLILEESKVWIHNFVNDEGIIIVRYRDPFCITGVSYEEIKSMI